MEYRPLFYLHYSTIICEREVPPRGGVPITMTNGVAGSLLRGRDFNTHFYLCLRSRYLRLRHRTSAQMLLFHFVVVYWYGSLPRSVAFLGHFNPKLLVELPINTPASERKRDIWFVDAPIPIVPYRNIRLSPHFLQSGKEPERRKGGF